MERDVIKETLKNWREDTPDQVKRATRIAMAKLPAAKNKSRRAWVAIAACACFMAVLFATPIGGYAMAALESVFGLFAQQRYAAPEQNAVIAELDQNAQTPPQLEVERTGDEAAISAKIDGVFYDGAQLVVSYSIQGRKSFDTAYVPSAQELASMTVLDANMAVMPNEGTNKDDWAQVRQKVEAGQPVGYRSYDVNINDGTYTKDGIDVPASTDDYFWNGDQKVGIRFYALTDELKQRDTLMLDIGFTVRETCYYFDGSKEYVSSKKCESQTLEVAAQKETAVQAQGSGAFEEYTANAALTVSSVFISAKVELTPLGESAQQKAWLAHYQSEFDLKTVPTGYRILDTDGNIIAQNATGGSMATRNGKVVMNLMFTAGKDLPKQLVLSPTFADGQTARDEAIHVTLP